MLFTEQQLELISNLLDEQLQEDSDYYRNAMRLTVSQTQDQELKITIRQNKPVWINAVHQAVCKTMGVDVYTEKERKAYKDTFIKKWALENYSKEGSHTETVIYTPEYSEKIFDQYRATFLQQDHQIHEQLQATPLLPELAHEVIEFAMGKGPCSRSNQCPTLFYQKATNPEPESKPKPGPTSHHCALL